MGRNLIVTVRIVQLFVEISGLYGGEYEEFYGMLRHVISLTPKRLSIYSRLHGATS